MTDIFLYDLQLNTTKRISNSTTTRFANNPSISNDGRYVAYMSTYYNLPAAIMDADVYLYDTQTEQTTTVTSSAFLNSQYKPQYQVILSDDGRYIVYETIRNSTEKHIFSYDIQAQKNTRIISQYNYSYNLELTSVSDDGRYVLLMSN